VQLDWLSDFPRLRILGDMLVRWRGRLSDKAHNSLELAGTLAELFGRIEEPKSMSRPVEN
jgi:hypothetical protein